jgi:pSer/pThr/pTyr-binding forkhead associated (FHA) protein
LPEPSLDIGVEQTPSARISLLMPPIKEFSALMTASPFSIGRRKDNDAVIPLDASSGVSGHHFKLFFSEGKYFAQDDQSTYGTTVNGVELVKGQPHPVPDGAIIGLGPEVKIRFERTLQDISTRPAVE